MKKSLLLLLLIVTYNLFAITKENETKVKSDIKEVTVFLSGASVTSSGSCQIVTGSNDLVFDNLSPYIDPISIQAKGVGNFTILAVTFHTNYLSEQPKSKEIKLLEDSLENLQLKISLQKNIRFVYEAEESFLLANKNIGGANTGVNAAELDKIATILRTRLVEIKSKTLESILKEKKLDDELVKVNNQLNEQNSLRNKSLGEIVVTVSADSPGTAKVSLTYNVSNAGWSPVYDIRASDSNSPITLDYRANVFQNTGNEWKNVKLILSTGNPTLSGTQPVLNPWRLVFYNPNQYYRNSKLKASESPTRSQPSQEKKYDSKSEEIEFDKEAGYAYDYTQVSETQTNILYEISIPYTISSESKPQSVGIQNYSLPAVYTYFCAPKLDKDAFLLAKITGWDKYNLISGESNVFFDGTFVGKAYLNTMKTADTLDISLGRDKSVVVLREVLKNYSEKKIIGINTKETKAYEIIVRNKKKQEIEINIEDQVPLSTSSEIEVELVEGSGGTFDKETGKIAWKMKLPSSDTKKIKFSYFVKYPKDKIISNL
ncbi:MAG: DUF4139 domain-containing protein [Bacteroidetes bacterium]|nr:DUF4139 domain-containing protein [Bacteroidota bacterium]HET6245364.1 DUF4139 domain-containing protein [Bacteroidia bacterium]